MLHLTSCIPIPKPIGLGRPKVYPWGLAVGDDFLAAGKKITDISGLAYARKRKHPGENYTCRTVDGGVRVWRTA